MCVCVCVCVCVCARAHACMRACVCFNIHMLNISAAEQARKFVLNDFLCYMQKNILYSMELVNLTLNNLINSV